MSVGPAKSRSNEAVELPIADRMTKRSQTLRTGPKPVSPLPSPGLTRSLTISNPDPPSPARHARSRTADSASIYTMSTLNPPPAPLMRPVRPRIVIPPTVNPDVAASMHSDRYPAFPGPVERNKLYPPTSYPSSTATQPVEFLQTPKEGPSPLDEIYDEYRSPTPELEADPPEMPYTAIGRTFASPSPISAGKSASPSLPPSSYRAPAMPSLARAESTRSNPALSRSASTSRSQGLMLTVEDADGLSPVSSAQDLIKIRVKVGSVSRLSRDKCCADRVSGPSWQSYTRHVDPPFRHVRASCPSAAVQISQSRSRSRRELQGRGRGYAEHAR